MPGGCRGRSRTSTAAGGVAVVKVTVATPCYLADLTVLRPVSHKA